VARIYISSTYEDLKVHRKRVYRTLRKMSHDVVAMEDYVAADVRPVDKCLADVVASDVYIGIFARRYGHCPPHDNPQGRSITEMELRCALEKKKETLLFFLHPRAKWRLSSLEEDEGAASRLKALLKEMATDRTVQFFRKAEELATLVSVAVNDWEKRSASPRPHVHRVAEPSAEPDPRAQQNHYGHPYQENVDSLVAFASVQTRGQLVTCLGPPGSLKSLLAEDAANRLQKVRRIVRINVSSGASIDTFEEQLKRGSDLTFEDVLYGPPLFIVIDPFHYYFTHTTKATPAAFRLWPERLRALTVRRHFVVLCGSLSPQHLYNEYGKRQQVERGSWNLNPNQLHLRPDRKSWYRQLADATGRSLTELKKLAALAEHQPGVLIAALDAIDLRNLPAPAIADAQKNYADEIAFASPPCCRELLKQVSKTGTVDRNEAVQSCREALVAAQFLIDSPAGLRLAAPSWAGYWRDL
jgi:hypothetical protein